MSTFLRFSLLRARFAFVFFISLISLKAEALSSETLQNETQTRLEYATAWRSYYGSQLFSTVLNEKLDLLQRDALKENKFINIIDIQTHADGDTFITYEISNKMGEIAPFWTYAKDVSAWTGSGLAIELENQLDAIQSDAKKANRLLNIKKITISYTGHALILYETSNQVGKTNSFWTHIEYVSGWTPSSVIDAANEAFALIQSNAKKENQILRIKDIFISFWGGTFIIYELSETIPED